MTQTLYELSQDWLKVSEMDLEEDVLTDTLESINASIEDKADNIARIIKNRESDIDGLNKEIKRLSDRKASIINSNKSLKLYLQDSMATTGKMKFKTDLFSFNIQKNPPSVKIVDESAIPQKYYTTLDPVLSKTLIKDAITAGNSVPGAEMMRSESVRIR